MIEAASEDVVEDTAERQVKAWREFVSYLRRKNLRVTFTRRQVLEHIFSRNDHFRSEDVVNALECGQGRVSRSTVYATIEHLVQAGLLRQLRDSDMHAHYECVLGNIEHEHMICDCCGEFIEFSNPELNGIIERECGRMGFAPRTHRVAVFGICRRCLSKNAGRK